MHPLLLPACLLFVCSASAQLDTDIYIGDINVTSSAITIQNLTNISQNPGYDNQPHFAPDGQHLFYTGTREGQTDIVRVDLQTGEKSFLSETPGSEYSPTPIPGQAALSAVRLETDGRQLLYRYPVEGESPDLLIPYVKIGYHVWLDEGRMLAFVLGNPATLQLIDLKNQTAEILTNTPGRTLLHIPDSKRVSFVDRSERPWVVRAYDPLTGDTAPLAETLEGIEDMTWLNSQTLLSARGNELYAYVVGQSTRWQQVQQLDNLGTITRMAVSPSGQQIALVARDANAPMSPAELAQAQLVAYNRGDIDAFMAPYAEEVTIYNFPDTQGLQGKAAMRPRYALLFENAPDLNCELVHREVYENYVIDHEFITGLPNGGTARATAIYYVENGKIQKVYFIR